jgi:hypothetical protein
VTPLGGVGHRQAAIFMSAADFLFAENQKFIEKSEVL